MKKKSTSTAAQKVAKRNKERELGRKKMLEKVSPQSIMALLPNKVMDEIAQETGADVQVKHLFGSTLVRLFIMAILEEQDKSLQALSDLYNTLNFSLFNGGKKHKTAKTSLSDRLSTIKCEFFEKLFEYFIEALKARFGKQLGQRLGWLTRVDSTMIALCASITEIGMRVGARPKKGKGKVQIKVTVGLEGVLPSTVKIHHEQSFLSEERALKDAIETQVSDKEGIVCFDMGLKSRKSFQSFDQQGIMFVTRLKTPRYEVIREHKQIKGRKHGDLIFESDQIVHLYQSGSSENVLEHEFRLIIATCWKGENQGKTIYFLTNILDLTAFEVTDIYLRRWDIEVFFRFLKQEVGLEYLLATKANGIKAVIYLRILTGTMIWVCAHLNDQKEYRRVKKLFYNALRWEIDLVIAQLINMKRLTKSDLYLIHSQ